MTSVDEKTTELIAKILSEDNAYANYYDQEFGMEASDDDSDYVRHVRRKKGKKGVNELECPTNGRSIIKLFDMKIALSQTTRF
jgi:hypothetical protein